MFKGRKPLRYAYIELSNFFAPRKSPIVMHAQWRLSVSILPVLFPSALLLLKRINLYNNIWNNSYGVFKWLPSSQVPSISTWTFFRFYKVGTRFSINTKSQPIFFLFNANGHNDVNNVKHALLTPEKPNTSPTLALP